MRNYFFCLRWNFAPNFRSNSSPMIERLSFECRKVIGFALSTRCDWLKRFAPPFHLIRSKTKANCNALACIFPRFASATCNYFEFWLVQVLSVSYVIGQSNYFGFGFTTLKRKPLYYLFQFAYSKELYTLESFIVLFFFTRKVSTVIFNEEG